MKSQVQHISITIDKPKDEVYTFVSEAENFPKWLAFVASITLKMGNIFTAETTLGTIKIAMPLKNDFGVIDHVVTLADGTKVPNPLRVIPNGEKSEVVFTLFKAPGKTEKQFNDDAELVATDLKTLKKILEKQ